MEELCQPTYAATPAAHAATRHTGSRRRRRAARRPRLTHDAAEEGGAQVPVVLVVEEGDHVGQQHVVGLLPPEEDAQARHAVLHQRLLDDVLRVAQQRHHLLLHQLVQGLQL